MTTETRNEGADALLKWAYSESGVTQADARLIEANLNAALDNERRATVARIKHDVLFQRNRLGRPVESIRVTEHIALLDGVAK